jgi:antibiotic biosynthesis monooxygenase (ABM) superfamily enzyme
MDRRSAHAAIVKLQDNRRDRMIFELRQYRLKPGQRERWVKWMEEKIIPYQVALGVVIVGSFIAEEDPDVYVWIRRFDNEQERQRLYAEMYESQTWLNEIKPVNDGMIIREKIQVTRLLATPKSVIH